MADYEAYLRRNDPISAGMEGDLKAQSLLPDISRRAELAKATALEALIHQGQAIDPAALDHHGRLNLAYILYLAQREVERIGLDNRTSWL